MEKNAHLRFHKNLNFSNHFAPRLKITVSVMGFFLCLVFPQVPMLFHELPEAEYLEGVRTEVAVGTLAANANQQHYSRSHDRYPGILHHVYMCICRRF